jgi:Protein of unknown function (DUF3551)
MLWHQRDIGRSAMRILFCKLAMVVVIAGIGTRAEAQNYPWCADYAGFGSQNCGFSTFQQCLAALSGNGGFCNANTQCLPQTCLRPETASTRDRSVSRTMVLRAARGEHRAVGNWGQKLCYSAGCAGNVWQ